MPAGRDVLRARAHQPGHDTSWRDSEERFSAAARAVLPARFEVIDKPRDLSAFYRGAPRPLGLVPEAKILDTLTGRYVFVEVKRQGPGGNAEERAYKHHTMTFARLLAQFTGFDYHAYVSVFCEDLATEARYTTKFVAHIEPGHYLLWDGYAPLLLAGFLDELRDRFLDPDRTCAQRCVDLAPAAAQPPMARERPLATLF